MRPYGMHARFAHRAIEESLDVGLLLPCNVIFCEEDGGATHVAAIDPIETIAAHGTPALKEIAHEVHDKLERVIARVGERVRKEIPCCSTHSCPCSWAPGSASVGIESSAVGAARARSGRARTFRRPTARSSGTYCLTEGGAVHACDLPTGASCARRPRATGDVGAASGLHQLARKAR